MAIATWIGGVDFTLSTSANWSPAYGSLSGVSLQFNSSATTYDNFGLWSYGTISTTGCFYVADNFPGTAITILDGSGGTRTIAGNAERINGYALYVGAGKTVKLPRIIWPRTDVFGESDVYVGANGLFTHSDDSSGTPFGSDRSTSSLSLTLMNKFGTGTFRMGPNAVETSTLGAVRIREGIVQAGFSNATRNPFGLNSGVYAPVEFNGTGVELQFGFFGTLNSFTIPNPLTFTTGGTIKSLSGFSATLTATPTGSGTITIGNGGGSLTWNANIANALNVVGTLTLNGSAGSAGSAHTVNGTLTMNGSSAYNLSGATLVGAGTINIGGGTITCDAPSFTGNIAGNFVYGVAGQTRTMNGLCSGTVDTVSGATVIFTDRTRTGSLNNLVASTVTVRGTFQGGGDGYVDVQNGTTLTMDGPNAAFNHKISVWGAGKLALTNFASLPANNEVWVDFPTTAVAASDVLCDDTSTCTINGPWTCGNSSSVGDIRISSKGVLVIKQPVNNNVASRAIKINETSSAYTGVVRVDTGGSFPSSSLVSVSRGTLYLASTSTVAFSTGLTVNAAATLACASAGAYAAQIAGNVTLAANSILKFGAP